MRPGTHNLLLGLVLAGGQSRRLGRDKAGLPWQGETLLQRAARLLYNCGLPVVIAGRPAPPGWVSPPATFLPDPPDVHGCGPIAGVLTTLESLLPPRRAVLAIGCDMPLLSPALLGDLIAHWDPASPGLMACTTEAGVPLDQPLLAIYSTALVPLLRERVRAGRHSLWQCAEAARVPPWQVPAELAWQVASINDAASLERIAARSKLET